MTTYPWFLELLSEAELAELRVLMEKLRDGLNQANKDNASRS